MHTSTITSKGQTTIPSKIREFLKLDAGDKLRFTVEEDGRVTIIPATVDVANLKGALPKPKKKVSLQAMENAIHNHNGGDGEGA